MFPEDANQHKPLHQLRIPAITTSLVPERTSPMGAHLTELEKPYALVYPTSPTVDDEVEEDHGMPHSHPLVGLQGGNPVPPFLSKTFDLVDDVALDPIISWGLNGESFVVWDPVEFARLVLPRNFKHSNFSSFVRQLNTYGFRKIDPDKWEFANEAFRRGERHLLKNIQRRKSPQSQQAGSYSGSSTEIGKAGLEGEVEKLRKERSMMMQEVVQLQQQQRGTVRHMEVIGQKLEATERRQKQMISFLAKVVKKPVLLAHLMQKKEQGDIGSSRMKRKFIRNQQHELSQSELSMERQIVKYRPDSRNLTSPFSLQDINPVPFEHPPDDTLQGMVEMGPGEEGLPFQFENVSSDELAMLNDLGMGPGFMKTTEQVGEGSSSLRNEDPHLEGNILMSPHQEFGPECFVSLPEDLEAVKNFLEFPLPEIESLVKPTDVASMGFDSSACMSGSSNMLFGNLANCDVQEWGLTDIWDIGSMQAAGSSGIDRWPADE